MKGRGLWAAAACLLAIAIVVGGCGSSDSSSNAGATAADASETTEAVSTSSKPLTQEEYVKAANQICQEKLKEKDDNVTGAIKAVGFEAAAELNRQQAAKVVSIAILPVYREIVDQLAELKGPKSDQAAIDLMIQKYEVAMKASEDNPASALGANPFQAGDRAAAAYKITGCVL